MWRARLDRIFRMHRLGALPVFASPKIVETEVIQIRALPVVEFVGLGPHIHDHGQFSNVTILRKRRFGLSMKQCRLCHPAFV